MSKEKRELLRDKKKGKIAGVCAGIADYFGIETWLVRIICVTAAVFGQGFVIVLYIAGWFILDEKPEQEQLKEEEHIAIKKRIWQAGEPPAGAFREVSGEYQDLEVRLQKMERYVTSNAYRLDRELKQL
ncbi:envelope stress response membrane protein PspC [Pseudidiomarina taiwanensis]|uniref:Envelope stress response membrane protein PspC n=1 Tax=Pseudidiomarina taiwanensis TaxID=337250 RepID=A0A432ZNJ5_9GAMM|nr:envelope stress response membrane protein PspC [Pseudidiomarina taiwanensis]RUO79432.1 envelope stress response membrane protein PspC [Pseudidiomarina taiwanensis]